VCVKVAIRLGGKESKIAGVWERGALGCIW